MKKVINIKTTILYICSIFRFFGINYITPEDLRLAKHNKHPDINVSEYLFVCLILIRN